MEVGCLKNFRCVESDLGNKNRFKNEAKSMDVVRSHPASLTPRFVITAIAIV